MARSAGFLGKQHADKSREKIKSTQILNRLQNHVIGKNEMSATQVRAAEILLKKTLPDLSQTTLDANIPDEGGSLKWSVEFINPAS